MAENKTFAGSKSVDDFMMTLDEAQRNDCEMLMSVISTVVPGKPRLWGSSIIGFGSYHYRYPSGREGDSALIGLSPRKQNISLYLAPDFSENPLLLRKLGKYKVGKGCLSISRVSEIKIDVLKKIIENSILHLETLYGKSNVSLR